MSQVPSASVADCRSTTPLEASTPEAVSVPSSSVTATEAVVYHGPPTSAADWPLGAVASAVSVIVSLELLPPVL